MLVHDNDPSGLMPVERDACAIICYINKAGRPTHGNVQRTIDALIKMGHRAGEIDGEGDGCGILTDIPRLIWAEILSGAGLAPALADDPGFAVGHFLVERGELARHPELSAAVLRQIDEAGLEVLAERPGLVRSEVLAPRARAGEPLFWQVAVRCPSRGKWLPAGSSPSRVAIEREVSRPCRLPCHRCRRLQGARRTGDPAPLLPGTEAARVSLGGHHRPQPVLDQHPAYRLARPALLAARP